VQNQNKKLKINIIPLIDIIFLMLVFFMLATNFNEKRELQFSIEKKIGENSELEKTIIINIKNNKFIYNNKVLEKRNLEQDLVKIWKSSNSKNFVILNDKSSEIENLVRILDILKVNKIKNVTFSDDPKKEK
jgi:biopolymer transport protein ExbD